jgi:hypothetical protein
MGHQNGGNGKYDNILTRITYIKIFYYIRHFHGFTKILQVRICILKLTKNINLWKEYRYKAQSTRN